MAAVAGGERPGATVRDRYLHPLFSQFGPGLDPFPLTCVEAVTIAVSRQLAQRVLPVRSLGDLRG